MHSSVILVTKKNIAYLNKNIKKINSKIRLSKDHLELYLSWIVITNDQKKAKWMKDVSNIEELLYPSLLVLQKNYCAIEVYTVFDFFNNYKKAIQNDIPNPMVDTLTLSATQCTYKGTSTHSPIGSFLYEWKCFLDDPNYSKLSYNTHFPWEDRNPSG